MNFLPELCGEVLKLSLSKLCVVPRTLQNRALFEGGRRANRRGEKERKRGSQQRGQKGKKDVRKQVNNLNLLGCDVPREPQGQKSLKK